MKKETVNSCYCGGRSTKSSAVKVTMQSCNYSNYMLNHNLICSESRQKDKNVMPATRYSRILKS